MKVLLVPMKVNGIYLEHDQLVASSMADFSQLPNGNKNVNSNADTPYLGDEISSKPFENKNLCLPAGIHLHWQLPTTLKTGKQAAIKENNGSAFPAVPNRWLVICSSKEHLYNRWMIESDYLYPSLNKPPRLSNAFPAGQLANGEMIYRYLGRQLTYLEWLTIKEDPLNYLTTPLTAIGYGEPNFSAFYPNCLSVFGCYDEMFHKNNPPMENISYLVIGWYDNQSNDFFKSWLQKTLFQPLTTSNTKVDLIELVKKAALDELKWNLVDIKEENNLPQQMLCCGIINFSKPNKTALKTNLRSTLPSATVVIGNTTREAISTYIADTIIQQKSIDHCPIESRAQIEQQLEFINNFNELSKYELDIEQRFSELYHENSFLSVVGESIWDVQQDQSDKLNISKTSQSINEKLAESIILLLGEINQLQRLYDKEKQSIKSLEEQLFSEWYQYQISMYPRDGQSQNYPSPDLIKHYIVESLIPSLKKNRYFTGELVCYRNKQGNFIPQNNKIASNIEKECFADAIAVRLANKLNQLYGILLDYNKKQHTNLELVLRAGARYWQAREPALFLSWQLNTQKKLHQNFKNLNQSQHLQVLHCKIVDIASFQQLAEDYKNTWGIIEDVCRENADIIENNWEHNPWLPFLLEWAIEVYPLKSFSNPLATINSYQKEFINKNYTLKEHEHDLTLQSDDSQIKAIASFYKGRSILVSQELVQLKDDLENYFLKSYYQLKNTPMQERVDDYFEQHSQEIIAFLKEIKEVEIFITAYELLINKERFCLSQVLSGFNAALLMKKQTLQLDILDPSGFPADKEFAALVRSQIRSNQLYAPIMQNDFCPIRTGMFKIRNLRLVDTFGQIQDLEVDKITLSKTFNTLLDCEKLCEYERQARIPLPPRITQPARLNAKWLAATNSTKPATQHETPILGWFLINQLNQSLMIYDNSGEFLGVITQFMAWEQGSSKYQAPTDIPNPYLAKTIQFFVEQDPQFYASFLTALNHSFNYIQPETQSQHQQFSYYVSRPIALVRLQIKLELLGSAAQHLGWLASAHRLNTGYETANNFTTVQFPIRLGEHFSLNDGLVGYWIEEEDRFRDNLFYMPQNSDSENDSIITHEGGSGHLKLSLADEPLTMSLLFDPRAILHITSGFLPCKTLDIPAAYYQQQLQNLSLKFKVAPLITPQGQFYAPTSKIPGYIWKWQGQEGNKTFVENIKAVGEPNILNGQQTIQEGWLWLEPNKETDK